MVFPCFACFESRRVSKKSFRNLSLLLPDHVIALVNLEIHQQSSSLLRAVESNGSSELLGKSSVPNHVDHLSVVGQQKKFGRINVERTVLPLLSTQKRQGGEQGEEK